MQNRLVRIALFTAAVIALITLVLFASGVLSLPAAPASESDQTAAVTMTLAVSNTPELSPTITAVTPQVDFNRATSTPSNETPSPTAVVTFSPTLFLTPFVPPTEVPTVPPLAGLGSDVELSIVQIYNIDEPQGVIIIAEVANVTEQPLENVRLIFTTPDGQRVGDPISLNLSLLPGETRPGASDELTVANLIVEAWEDLQPHAVGTPPSAQPDQPGYPVMATVGFPNISRDGSSFSFDVLVVNDTGFPIAITGQNLAFYNGQGILLLVVNLGPRDTVAAGESYVLTGTVPLSRAASQGHTLAEYTDVIVSITAEISP